MNDDIITAEELDAWDRKGPGATTITEAELAPPAKPPGFWERTGIPSLIKAELSAPKLISQVPGAIMDIARQGRDPITEWSGEMGRGLLQGMKEGADRASIKHVDENPVSRAIHTFVGATPIVGPMVEAVGEDLDSGNYAGLAGTITGALAPVAFGRAGTALNLPGKASEAVDMARGPLRDMGESIGLKPRNLVDPFKGAATDRPLSQRLSPFSPSDEAWVAKRGIIEGNRRLDSVGAPQISSEITSTSDVAKAIESSLKEAKGFKPGGTLETQLTQVIGAGTRNPTDVGNTVAEAIKRSQERVRGQVGPRLASGRAAAESTSVDRELATDVLENTPEATVPAVRRAKSRITGDTEAEGWEPEIPFNEADLAASDLGASRGGKLAGEDLKLTLRNSLKAQSPSAARKLASAEEEAATRLTPFQKGGPARVLSKADQYMPEAAVSQPLTNTTHWEQIMKSVGNDPHAIQSIREHVAHNVLGFTDDLNTFKTKWKSTPPATKDVIFGSDAAAVDNILDNIERLAADNTGKLKNLQTVLDQYSPSGWGRKLVSRSLPASTGAVAGGLSHGTTGAVTGALLGGIVSIMGEVANKPGAMAALAKGFDDFARLGRPQGLLNVVAAAQRQQTKGKNK